MTNPSEIVVVGASAAGLATVEALRRNGFGGSITVIGDENELPYDRPPLSKQVLAGKWSVEQTRLRSEAALTALDMDLRLGVRAEALDPARRRITVSDGSTLEFDDLVIATGVRARTLPETEGVAGVFTLRTASDAMALREQLGAGRRLVVVGAGFLGAEAASVARDAGADVTLISNLDSPLSDVLGAELGEMLVSVHEEHGVEVLRGIGVDGVVAEHGHATGVRLADGRTVAADAVLVAIGSVPNTEWLHGSGIPVGNGVLCNTFGAAAPRVWAAGDVASWVHGANGERMRIEHRTNAGEMGAMVAHNILAKDDPTPYSPIPYIWSDQYDLKIQIYGTPRGHDRQSITEGSTEERSLVALYGAGGTVCAAVGVNRIRATRSSRAHLVTRTPWATAVSRQSSSTEGASL